MECSGTACIGGGVGLLSVAAAGMLLPISLLRTLHFHIHITLTGFGVGVLHKADKHLNIRDKTGGYTP